jgi:hypothetical protein
MPERPDPASSRPEGCPAGIADSRVTRTAPGRGSRSAFPHAPVEACRTRIERRSA